MSIDLKKDLPHLYRPGARDFVEVDVPPRTYLAIDGEGDPNTSAAYREAIETIYPAAYAVRKAFKQRTGDAFVVGPLEALWWAEDPADFARGNKDTWKWTLLIPLPDEVAREDMAATGVEKREIREGRCLQILHVGPYDAEGPTLHRLHHEVMPAQKVTFNGPHHEIYLSDVRKTAPEKLRTVLRQPVRPE